MTEYLLALSCPDRTGLIYAVMRWLLEKDCSVLDSDTYKDHFRERFFMRVHFSGDIALDELRESFDPRARELQMRWELVLARAVQYHAQKRVLINGRRTVVFR